MAKVGAQRAADLTGRSKSTIQRAMNNGKLSYEVDPNGRRVIDVSELDRAFGLQQTGGGGADDASVERELEKASSMIETERLKMRVKMLEEQLEMTNNQISDLKDQRDKWQKQASQVLITSQYTQKEAEDLRAEIKEREKRARDRRQQQLENSVKKLKADNENETSSAEAAETAENAENFNFKGLWKRVKGISA